MSFEITLTEDAERQLRSLSAREQRMIEGAVLARLVHEPCKTSRSVRLLRPNPFAQFEMRVGELRVLYNVENDDVVLLIVGRKVGNALIVEGEEFHAHRDNPPEHSGGGPSGNA